MEQVILGRAISLIVCLSQMPDFSACDVLDLLERRGVLISLLVVSEDGVDPIAHEALRRWAIDCVFENDRQRFAARQLQIASDAAHFGGWMLELRSKRITWWDPGCEIYGVPRNTSPTLGQVLSYVAAAFWKGINDTHRR